MRACILILSTLCLVTAALAEPVAITFGATSAPLGETAKRLDRGFKRLCAPPLDDPAFVLSDINFTYVRRFTEYSGDVSGRMIGALNEAEQMQLSAPAMMTALLEGAAKTQQPDGHFGVPQDLAKGVSQQRDTPILWGNGRMLLALAERYRTTKDDAILAEARKLGDYIVSTRPYYGIRENFERVGGQLASGFTTCYPSLVDGLVALGEVTGDAKYFDEARFIGSLSMLDQSTENHHSHGRLVTYRGLLDLDRLSGTAEFTPTIAKACENIWETLTLPTGGVTEVFDLSYARDEGCSETDWARVNLYLWRATGDTKYLDRVEHILFNHFYAVQFDNGGFGHQVFVPCKNGDAKIPGGMAAWGSDSYWCCGMHCTQFLAELPHWAAVSANNELYVPLLAEARMVFTVNGKEITVSITRDTPWTWTVALESAVETKLPVNIRVPGWAETLRVNGDKEHGKDGWARVECAWTGKTTLTVELPNRVHIAAAAGDDKPEKGACVRIFAGPVMYALPEPLVNAGILQEGIAPEVILPDDEGPKGVLPAVVRGVDGRLQRVDLEPMEARTPGACRFIFRADSAGKMEFERLAKEALAPVAPGRMLMLQAASDANYDLYLDGARVFNGGGWSESPRVQTYTTKTGNVLAVKCPYPIGCPGVIALARDGAAQTVTDPAKWEAALFVGEPSAEWLAGGASKDAIPCALEDLGGFGAAPWNHTPAHFASSGARWIWPAKDTKNEDAKWCAFRRTLDTPSQ